MSLYRKMKIPDNALDHQVTQEILEGQSYPAPPLRPEVNIRTIVDIGACIGAFAVYAHNIWPSAHIQCWEPSPVAAALLRENAPFADIFASGVAGHLRNLYLSPNNRLALSKLTELGGDIPQATLIAAPSLFQRLKNPADIIKIDTEGMEVEILYSIQPHINAAHVVYVESHNRTDMVSIHKLLTTQGLTPFCIGGFWPNMEMAYINPRSAKP